MGSRLSGVAVVLFTIAGLPGSWNGCLPRPLAAQTAGQVEVAGSTVAGRVVDAETRVPLEGVTVELDPEDGGPSPAGAGLPLDRAVVTGSDGEYRFLDLPAGPYRLRLERIGYLGRAIEVELGRGVESGLSVGLDVDPIALPVVEVTGAPPPPYARLRPIIESRNERDAYALQQERHIVSDSRELTRSEVFEAVTLAESDLFRALQRVPGVGTRDDYTATMWTRGASWDQTRVYFDGMPLYNPTHAGWLFAAVNPEAIGAASFHPGYRSAEWGEGTAAVLDLRSRRGRSGEPFGGNAEVSLVSARLSADGEIGDGKANWLIALRRSYVDLLDGFLAGLADREELQIAYDFSDVAARLDGELGNGWRYEASGILERDHLRGDIPGLLRGNRGRWGNQAGRITLEAPFGPLLARATVGGTNFSTFIVEEDAVEGWRGATLPTLENAIAHRTLALEVQPMAREGSERPWAAGLQLMRDTVTYEGTYSLLGALVSGGTRDPLVHRPYDYGNALAHSALWGERRWELAPRATALTGIRAEFGDSVHNGGRLRLAPRLAVRLGPFTGTTVSGSWSRSYQYIQDIAPAAGPIGPQLHLSAIWVLASPARVFPAARADLTTVGVEHTLAADWQVVANVYRREATGLKIPNPLAGAIVPERDTDAEASNDAKGLELVVRRINRRWTGALSYSYGISDLSLTPRSADTEVAPFPSSADIRHGFDATTLVRVGGGVQLGGAFTYGSGVPFTRLLLAGDDGQRTEPRLGPPNAVRTPSYASLDVVLDYSIPVMELDVSGYVQIRNLTNRDNSVTYSGSWDCPGSGAARLAADSPCGATAGVNDRFEPGLPRLALLGFRIEF